MKDLESSIVEKGDVLKTENDQLGDFVKPENQKKFRRRAAERIQKRALKAQNKASLEKQKALKK